MRLIDADELKETLHETTKDDPRVKWWYDLIGVDDAIDFSPTITFNPPKHGRWDEEWLASSSGSGAGYKIWRCSECQNVSTWQTDYCPNCGAKMDIADIGKDNVG